MQLTIGRSTLAAALAAIVVAGPGAAASSGLQGRPDQHGLCAGPKRDRIRIRVVRPAISYRVPPSIEQINESGDRYVIMRDSAVWKTVADRLCADITSGPRHAEVAIRRRITMFVDGNSEHEIFALEYPDVLLNDSEFLKGEISGRNVLVHSDDIRVLLDYAASERPR